MLSLLYLLASLGALCILFLVAEFAYAGYLLFHPKERQIRL